MFVLKKRLLPFVTWLLLLSVAVSAYCYVGTFERANVKIGLSTWVGYEGFCLAEKQGKFKGAGIEVERFVSTEQVKHYCSAGLVQVACLRLHEALALVDKGSSLQIVALLDTSEGADAVLAKKDVSFVRNAQGQLSRKYKVAYEKSVTGEYLLARWLEIKGIRRDEVILVPVAYERHKQVFIEGDVDCLVTYSPLKEYLLREGAQVLFSSKEIAGEISDVLVAEKSFIDENADFMRTILEVRFKGIQALKEDSVIHGKYYQGLALSLDMSAVELEAALKGVVLVDSEQNKKYLKGGASSEYMAKVLMVADRMGYDLSKFKKVIRSEILMGLEKQ